jgi:hypothetical protein
MLLVRWSLLPRKLACSDAKAGTDAECDTLAACGVVLETDCGERLPERVVPALRHTDGHGVVAVAYADAVRLLGHPAPVSSPTALPRCHGSNVLSDTRSPHTGPNVRAEPGASGIRVDVQGMVAGPRGLPHLWLRHLHCVQTAGRCLHAAFATMASLVCPETEAGLAVGTCCRRRQAPVQGSHRGAFFCLCSLPY